MPKTKILIAKPIPSQSDPDFTNIDAIGEAFGVRIPHRGYLRPSGAFVPCRNLLLWWPNETSDKWENTISENGKTVTSRSREDAFDIRPIQIGADTGRLTAIFFKPKNGAYGYRFVGVFKTNLEASRTQHRHVYVQVADAIELP